MPLTQTALTGRPGFSCRPGPVSTSPSLILLVYSHLHINENEVVGDLRRTHIIKDKILAVLDFILAQQHFHNRSGLCAHLDRKGKLVDPNFMHSCAWRIASYLCLVTDQL